MKKKGLRKHLMKFQCQPEPPDSRTQASGLVKGKIARNLLEFEKQRWHYSRGRTTDRFISKVNITVSFVYILPLLLKCPCTAHAPVHSSLVTSTKIRKLSHVKPSKMHKLKFAMRRVSNTILKNKSAERTQEFYRGNIVKRVSSMPHWQQ